MIVKLRNEHHLEFLSLKEAAEARPSLHMSKCHIVGNLMHWLINHCSIGSKMHDNRTIPLCIEAGKYR